MADGATVVMIVRPDGRLVEDWRPMTTAYLLCTVEENGRMERDTHNVAARAPSIGVFDRRTPKSIGSCQQTK